jgi:hypothetical protein
VAEAANSFFIIPLALWIVINTLCFFLVFQIADSCGDEGNECTMASGHWLNWVSSFENDFENATGQGRHAAGNSGIWKTLELRYFKGAAALDITNMKLLPYSCSDTYFQHFIARSF